MTKFGVNAFSEALRQEALHAKVRVTCVEPGFVETELQGHNTNPVVQQAMRGCASRSARCSSAEDIADAIVYAVSRPARVDLNELGHPRPTGQRR